MSERAWWAKAFGANDASGDLLFTTDGTVKLPKLVELAITVAGKDTGCLTRQPTRERAEAVQEAVQGRVERRGWSMEIRHSERSNTWGLYVVKPAPESVPT